MSRKVYIAGAVRTAMGRFGGSLADVPAPQLAEIVVREAMNRAGVKPEQVDFVYFGQVLQAGVGQNVARQAVIRSGMPVHVPAVTVNVVCGSGLESVNLAARMIRSGEADIVVAGGVENMSAAPYLLKQGRYGYRMGDGKIVDSMTADGLTDIFSGDHMGITAENIVEQWGLTREEMDEFAAVSQNRAAQAQADGKLVDEIVPVMVKVKREMVEFKEDEGIRPGTTAEGLGKLRPAFKADGILTAGNSSTINDGAAAMVLISEEKAKELGVVPQVEWLEGALRGVEPRIMGIGPVAATQTLLNKMDVELSDFDLIEANEAFAAQSVAVLKDLGLDPEKVNVNGGASALGHPVGASGARILVILIHAMQRRDDTKLGLCTLCIGGGMGVAAAVRKA